MESMNNIRKNERFFQDWLNNICNNMYSKFQQCTTNDRFLKKSMPSRLPCPNLTFFVNWWEPLLIKIWRGPGALATRVTPLKRPCTAHSKHKPTAVFMGIQLVSHRHVLYVSYSRKSSATDIFCSHKFVYSQF